MNSWRPPFCKHPATLDVRLIDFDWAGQCGEARYRPNITNIAWEEGASLILPEDDNFFLDLLFRK
jgi:hypothetical protein